MNNICRHVFYTIYSWARKVKTNPAPEASTLVGLTFLASTNILTLLGLYSLVTGSTVEWAFRPRIRPLLLFGFFLVYLYSANLRGGKLAQIEAELSQEPERIRRRWRIITASYIIVSMLLLFLGMFVAMMHNRGVW